MELDEIAPSEWAKLETATDEYIATVGDQLDDCVAALTAGLPEPDSGNGAASGAAAAVALRLGGWSGCRALAASDLVRMDAAYTW